MVFTFYNIFHQRSPQAPLYWITNPGSGHLIHSLIPVSTLFKIYKLPILPGIRETAENLGKFEYNSLHWPGHDGNWSYYNIRRNRREGIQNYSAQETFQTHTNSNKSTLEYSQRRVSTLFLMDKKEAKKFWFSSNPNFPHFEGNSRKNVPNASKSRR